VEEYHPDTACSAFYLGCGGSPDCETLQDLGMQCNANAVRGRSTSCDRYATPCSQLRGHRGLSIRCRYQRQAPHADAIPGSFQAFVGLGGQSNWSEIQRRACGLTGDDAQSGADKLWRWRWFPFGWLCGGQSAVRRGWLTVLMFIFGTVIYLGVYGGLPFVRIIFFSQRYFTTAYRTGKASFYDIIIAWETEPWFCMLREEVVSARMQSVLYTQLFQPCL